MAKIPSVEGALAGFTNGSNKAFELDLQRGIMKAEPGEDYRNMMEAAQIAKEFMSVSSQAAPAKPAQKESENSGFTIRQMIENWLKVGTSNLKSSSLSSYTAAIEDFAAFFGDHRPVANVRKTDVSAWVERKSDLGNVKTTRGKKASHLNCFFEHAIEQGHYPEGLNNPVGKIGKVKTAEKDERAEKYGWAPFSIEQLQEIFEPDNLLQSEMPHTRRALVIGLYTGARVGEVAQLKLTAFTQIDGRACIEFVGDLKTKTSKRRIPIHPDLMRLGLMQWVDEEKRRGSERLLPTVDISKKNKGGAISKGTSNLLKMLEIKVEEGLENRIGFHSLRDNVVQELQGRKGVDSELRRAYVGHAAHEKKDRSVHRINYMREWKPEEIEPLHAGITWGSWLNFEGLRKVLEQRDPDPAFIAAKRNAARAATRLMNVAKKAQAQAVLNDKIKQVKATGSAKK